jgi:hypothetical protein
MRMSLALAVCGCALAVGHAALAQQTPTLKSTVVVLSAEPALRAEFEDGLVAKAREHAYNVVPSYEFVPDVADVNNRDFIKRMLTHGIGAVLMVRPADAGPDASLESVRDSVAPAVLANMRAFASDVSRSGEDDIVAVVHLAIYLISIDGAELISSGAVWLDEPNPSRAEGIERLQNLMLANVDAVRPAIRRHLGLPALE